MSEHPLYVTTVDSKGNVFPSLRACARAYGRHHKAVSYHLNAHGNLDRLGMGQARPGTQNAAKPFAIGSVTWPSMTKAAKDLGLTMASLRRRVSPNASPALKDDLFARLMARQAKPKKTRKVEEAF